MKYYSILFLSCFLFINCNEEKKLIFKSIKFEKHSSGNCNEDTCAKAIIEIPFSENKNSIAADSINNTTLNIINNIVSFDKSTEKPNSYEQIISNFIESFETMKEKFPKEGMSWEIDIKGKITYETPQLISVLLDHYTFFGGAHGYNGIYGLNFNPENGHLYTKDELIKDTEKLSELVEKKLREELIIPEGEDINSTGLMFEDNKFALPQTFLFFEDKFVAYYNTYEIASYADGPTKLEFSYDEVLPFLKLKIK